jgi:tetratricopeptide (TPR) repeat protein
MDQDHRSAAPETAPAACPACGTPYHAIGDGLGCPVCLLQEALDLAPEAGKDPSDHGPLPPDEGRFGHYELMRREDGAFDELGRGAMGVTYRALDAVLARPVALKVIEARIATRPEARERFLREARAAARLHHPHVASVFYYGVRKSDGQCFYAMELVEGESLEGRVRRAGPLPVAEALATVAQVARALAAAEAQGIVHRDLKPSNLMLVSGPELTVKVIDFGLAKAVASTEAATLTQGGFVGTAAFASPEQFGGGEVDVRSDLYSLGVTLWEMLTGQAPFRGSPAEVRRQHLQAPLPLERLQGVAQPVVALLQTLLQKDPACRFQSAAELLQALPTVMALLEGGQTLIQQVPEVPPSTRPGITCPRSARHEPEKVSIARLPVTGSALFGRDEDLAFLDNAWTNPQVNAVSIVAWAGVGKSTLVNHWLRRLAAEGYGSAELVFGWSFYRQGSGAKAVSADEFLDAALSWFGDPDPRLGTGWEKGERLAKLVAHRRTLLVLDGLEPLQHPPGPYEGHLREPALQALLRELAAFNRGLCLITTRLPIAELADYERSSAWRRGLEHLSPAAGALLLRALGVKGPEGELRKVSEGFEGHCLALTLLGSYLTDAYEGDVRRWAEVSTHLADDVRQGAHARKVMASYQSWFAEAPELSVLRLLGLFDRPADPKALEALLKAPAIPGLTESLTDLSLREWQTLLARLRRARLLTGEDPHQPGQLDAHPLVREYFGEQLRSQWPAAWREGHRRLYEHYRALAAPRPENVRDMERLFLAVTCGCRAGLFRDALQQVYMPRIQRGNASFAANALGARGALLSVLAHFFKEGRWGSLAQTDVEGQRLTAEEQLFILTQAGTYLTVTRGFTAPEARACYERAEALCRALDRPRLLYLALMGQYLHSLATDKLTATMRIARQVYALAKGQNDAALLIGAHRALAATFCHMGNFEAGRNHARRGVELWRSGNVSPLEEVHAPVVSCLCYVAGCELHFGDIAAGQATIAEAIALAKRLNDTHGLALALWAAACLSTFERNPAEVERLASQLIELSTRQSLAYWLTVGEILRGWARSASGRIAEGLACIEEGIRGYQATGSIVGLSYWLALKAEALHLADRTPEALAAIQEAETLAERLEEGGWRAELRRLRGVFLAAMGADEAQIEAAFHEAIRTAQQQKSIFLRKRAEASQAEYRGRRGSR